VRTKKAKKRIAIHWDPPLDVDGFPDETITHYEVQVSKSSTFSTILEQAKHVLNSHYRYTVEDADVGITHFARVRAIDDTGTPSAWVSSSDVPEDDSGVPGDGTITSITQFAHTIRPPVVVSSLPPLPNEDFPQGSFVFLITDQKLYRNSTGTTWTRAVDGQDIIADSITAGQIQVGAIGADEIAANAIVAGKIHATQALIGKLFTTNAGGESNYITIDGNGARDQVQFTSGGTTTVISATGGGIRFAGSSSGQLGFWGASPVAKPAPITGQRSTQLQNIVQQLLQALQSMGLITNSTTT
jgi:hypothetical protein